MAVSQVLVLVFIMAAHVLSFAVAMNVMTDHSMCTVAFAAMGFVICFVLGLPRTLKGVSYLSIFCECNTEMENNPRPRLTHRSLHLHLCGCHCYPCSHRHYQARCGQRFRCASRHATCHGSDSGHEHNFGLL
jgi:hypothetical protein